MQPLTPPQIMALANKVVSHGESDLLCLNQEGRVRYANKKACTTLGYSYEDMVGKSAGDYTPDWTPASWKAHFQRTIQNGDDHIYSHHQNNSGISYPVELLSVPYIVNETNEQLICSLVRSVEQSERYIRMMGNVESSFCIGSFDLDVVNQSMIASHNLKAIMGTKEEDELQPRNIVDRLRKEDVTRWMAHLENLMKGFYRVDENFFIRIAAEREVLMRVVMWSRLEHGTVTGITGHYEIIEESGKESMISLDESQRRHIIRALRYTNGRVTGPNGAGRLLKINGKTLFARMKKLNIHREDYTQR
ncbi:PAS domain-containing protein [Neolewinella litorea]|nr:PAS domain-containing protein [Neolewinella litorea]